MSPGVALRSILGAMLLRGETSELGDEMERASGRSGERTGSGGDEGAGEIGAVVVVVVREGMVARDGLGTRLW